MGNVFRKINKIIEKNEKITNDAIKLAKVDSKVLQK